MLGKVRSTPLEGVYSAKTKDELEYPRKINEFDVPYCARGITDEGKIMSCVRIVFKVKRVSSVVVGYDTTGNTDV
jgi:hypothetical protein